MWDKIQEVFYSIMILIDALVYSFIRWIYEIILNLADTNLFTNTEIIDNLVNRIYIVLGVIMLFLLAYSLLKNMVNPDEALKGKQSPAKLISNVIISVVLIAIVPTIFQFAREFQTALLKNNTIGKLIVGTDGSNSNAETISDGGFYMAIGVFQAFFHPTSEYCQYSVSNAGTQSGCTNELNVEGKPYSQFMEEVRAAKNFLMIRDLAPYVVDGDIEYFVFFSTIAGAFVLVVLFGYCLDIAIRTVKLAVYQLIAPLPILSRLVPGEQGKKVFSNWLKATVSTYLEVFIRLAILYFAVLVINLILKNWTTVFTSAFQNGAPFIISFLTMAFLIIGVILFVKQAPQLLKEITGLDGGKYNVLKSAAQGMALIGGGVAGRSPLAAVRAWEETGKDGSLKSIGNQYKRWSANKEARTLQENAGMGFLARKKANLTNSIRQGFGYGTTQEAADDYFSHNRGMQGEYFTVKNDSGSSIYLRDEHGNVLKDANGNALEFISNGLEFEYNENAEQKLNEHKANLSIIASHISQDAAYYHGIMDSNKKLSVKGSMEQIAKDEMAKNKYNLRGQNGNNLYIETMIDGKIVSIGGDSEPLTQNQVEEWFAANREKMSSEEVTRISSLINKSLNDYTVKQFIDTNGINDKGEENQDILKAKALLKSNLDLNGLLDVDGEKLEKFTVDGKTYSISDFTNNSKNINLDQVKALKKFVEESVNNKIEVEILHNLDDRKSKIENESKIIDRLQAQVKENIELQKATPQYTARKASSEASKIKDRGNKGGH